MSVGVKGMNSILLKQMWQMVDQLYDEMVAWRRDFHRHPELSFQEERTPRIIAQLLRSFGLHVREGVGGRGVVGRLETGRAGRTVALRADFDALPIQEETGVEYQSVVPGVMHACGHDGHTAVLLTVAKVLSHFQEHLSGNVVFIHQFAEEVAPGGAKPMIADGCLDGVDVIYGTHLWSGFPRGRIGCRSGPIMAATDDFEIRIVGRGGHGGMPHQAVDALLLGAQVVQQLQWLVSRRVDPLQPAVVTVGSFHAGETYNVIAGEATLKGTVRTLDGVVRDQVERDMERLVRGVCEAAGAEVEMQYRRGYPVVINHPEPVNDVRRAVAEVLGEEAYFTMEPLMVGEDFAYYLERVPGAFFFTGAGNPELDAVYPHHHPRFNFDERAMADAAKLLLTLAVSQLQGTD